MKKRILKKIKFSYFLLKKSLFQKKEGGSYFNKLEKGIKNILIKKAISKEEAVSAYEKLQNDLYQNFERSGVSLKEICGVLAGKIIYNRSGFTPDDVQQILVDNYCKTNGLFQEILFDFLYRDHNENLIIGSESPFFGEFDAQKVNKLAHQLKENGYIILPERIPGDSVSEIVNWSKGLEYTIIDDSLQGNFYKGKVDFNDPNFVKASAFEIDLTSNETIMRICKDPYLLSILQTAIGAKLDIWHLSMWWSFKTERPSVEAAQYYHYDLDTLRWLKIFVYLTDVNESNGPHTAIPGSHQVGSKNYKLLKKRYGRVHDTEMNALQDGEVVEYCAQAGTIIIGDTRCWHKGKEVKEGNRLILQPTYSPTYFLKRLVQ